MKFVDIPDASRITGDPTNRTTIISDGKIQQDGVEIHKIESVSYTHLTLPTIYSE